MARKKTLEQGIKAAQEYKGPINEGEKNKAQAVKVRQDIADLCASIGDRSFVIRQAEGEIVRFHARIDQLRDQLRVLEPQNGPQAVK